MRATSELWVLEAARRYPRVTLFVSLAILYASTASYGATSIDVRAAEQPAWAMATQGTFDLSRVPHRDLPWYFEHEGGIYSDRFPGAIFYLVPAYWAAAQLGLDEFTLIPGGLTAAIATAGAVVLFREVLATVLDTPRQVWAATFFLALGTGAWSIAANAPWSHTLNLLIIALALFLLTRDWVMLSGLALGVTITSRPTMAVGVAAFGLAMGLFRRSWRLTAVVGIATLPGVLSLISYNGIMFDRWSFSNGHELGGEIRLRVADLPMNVAGAVASPMRGLLFYYPVVILAAFALMTAWRAASDWERAAAIAGLAVLVTQLALNRYSGGSAFFGPRLVIEPLALAAPLLARAVGGFADTRRTIAIRLMALGGVIHGAGAIFLPY